MVTRTVFRFVCAALAAQTLASWAAAASWSASAASNDVAAATNGVMFKETVERPAPGTKLVAPSVLDVKRAVGRIQEKGITIYTRDAGIDTADGIAEMFQRCRAEDARVMALGPSKMSVQLEKYFLSPKFTGTVGLVRLHGKHFDLWAPHLAPGKSDKGVSIDEKSRAVLDAADAAFAAATEALVMGGFIDWSEVRGRIYLVTGRDTWRTVFALQSEPRPVQSVVQPRNTREFFVVATAMTNDYTCQAIAYTVAAAVLDEFALVTSGKPDAKEPLFFATGFAADISKLEAALTKEGPVQVNTYQIASKTYRVLRCVPGIVPPLKSKRLLPLDSLVSLTEYPTGGEDMYHLVRQSGAFVSALRTKGPLATIALARTMATGGDFKKEIGASYAAIQRDVEGCAAFATSDSAPSKSRFPEYDRLVLMIDPVFQELTEEYLTDAALRKAKEDARKPKPTK